MAENTLAENITQAISDFNGIKQAIEDKDVEVPAGTPTSEYADLIEDIPSGDNTQFIDLIERTATSIEVPQGTTHIGDYAFYNYASLANATIPDSVTSIGWYAFSGCSGLSSINIPDSVTSMGSFVFYYCHSLASVIIENGVTSIGWYMFSHCENLTSVTIPNSVTTIGDYAFSYCISLASVTFGNGFNANNLDLSASTLYSAATIVSWLNALADRTGLTPYTLTIGAANLAKLTAEQIAVATNKNWNLA